MYFALTDPIVDPLRQESKIPNRPSQLQMSLLSDQVDDQVSQQLHQAVS